MLLEDLPHCTNKTRWLCKFGRLHGLHRYLLLPDYETMPLSFLSLSRTYTYTHAHVRTPIYCNMSHQTVRIVDSTPRGFMLRHCSNKYHCVLLFTFFFSFINMILPYLTNKDRAGERVWGHRARSSRVKTRWIMGINPAKPSVGRPEAAAWCEVTRQHCRRAAHRLFIRA